jgi:hypothetical protein
MSPNRKTSSTRKQLVIGNDTLSSNQKHHDTIAPLMNNNDNERLNLPSLHAEEEWKLHHHQNVKDYMSFKQSQQRKSTHATPLIPPADTAVINTNYDMPTTIIRPKPRQPSFDQPLLLETRTNPAQEVNHLFNPNASVVKSHPQSSEIDTTEVVTAAPKPLRFNPTTFSLSNVFGNSKTKSANDGRDDINNPYNIISRAGASNPSPTASPSGMKRPPVICITSNPSPTKPKPT